MGGGDKSERSSNVSQPEALDVVELLILAAVQSRGRVDKLSWILGLTRADLVLSRMNWLGGGASRLAR
jgi:hypothetical protein